MFLEMLGLKYNPQVNTFLVQIKCQDIDSPCDVVTANHESPQTLNNWDQVVRECLTWGQVIFLWLAKKALINAS